MDDIENYLWKRNKKKFLKDTVLVKHLRQKHKNIMKKRKRIFDGKYKAAEIDLLKTIKIQNSTSTVYNTIVTAEDARITRYDEEGELRDLRKFIEKFMVYQAHVNTMNLFNILDLLSVIVAAHIDLRSFPACQLKINTPKLTISFFPSLEVISGGKTPARINFALFISRMIINSIRDPNNIRKYIVADQHHFTQNIVSSAILEPAGINNSTFFKDHIHTARYRPQQFVAVVLECESQKSKYRDEKLKKYTALVFDSGMVILCGHRYPYQIKEQASLLMEKMSKYRCSMTEELPHKRQMERIQREQERQKLIDDDIDFDPRNIELF